ncbi:hypothetical protein ABFU18_16280 [Xanthomonas campestris pv. campestris]|uniref:hypothetical protein n=1 Tax=Xanthomonas campestris TaxID=339 RepID=UPI000B3091B3|nr:hypothetical protein [Xanthomonas campestris]MCF8868254.1 hypothetical protein [Xanthomonas campestris pv. campestris]MEA9838089.1 hypothetical protein [Xanthomonas campestris pv. raphani]MEB1768904.1 hypothetical protein [Xanthomonas campestris pv. campestris]MEB2076372.1 hypothetical protein [Xanthomonas campestris pv. campestris]
MNTGNLKSYAPQARKDFIAAVTARANLLGLSEAKGGLQMAEAEVKNDIVMIAGRPWPVKVNEQRNKLIARMKLQGFGHTVEVVAYVWFNRLAALRYMEVHDSSAMAGASCRTRRAVCPKCWRTRWTLPSRTHCQACPPIPCAS